MSLLDIKLPGFPRFCKEDDRVFIKFYSPFHIVIVSIAAIELETNEDYDHTLLEWRNFLEEKYTECTPEEFQSAYSKKIQVLSNL